MKPLLYKNIVFSQQIVGWIALLGTHLEGVNGVYSLLLWTNTLNSTRFDLLLEEEIRGRDEYFVRRQGPWALPAQAGCTRTLDLQFFGRIEDPERFLAAKARKVERLIAEDLMRSEAPTLKIGTSVSTCFLQMAEGRVSPYDVGKIIGGTAILTLKGWDALIKEYEANEWSRDLLLARQAGELLLTFLAEGRIYQPRLVQGWRPPTTPNIWVDSEAEITKLTNPE